MINTIQYVDSPYDNRAILNGLITRVAREVSCALRGSAGYEFSNSAFKGSKRLKLHPINNPWQNRNAFHIENNGLKLWVCHKEMFQFGFHKNSKYIFVKEVEE